MADCGDTIHAIATYLGVKCSKITYDGPERIPVMKGKTGTRKGFLTIVKHLVRAAEKQRLIGEIPEEKAVVDQWLEYKVCHIDRCPSDKDKLTILKDLDNYLKDKVYFLHHRLCLIDIVLYYTFQPTFAELTFYDKQKYMHLSRWFDNVQQTATIRQSIPLVTFSKTQLYTASAH
ncbi:eukaryotic translation elongation factor 1 epsilon-1-like [Mercenaria mercenaria]|uniref:eukaryotic translation elongation factor 1 epsilon-1-like n=1 Tax=Mercenaria mercenaria TaxID=6596 RepID=UPI00234E5150|nr:eukaryotic translation elongation factor 1 epsilon-1-like [Mercenaria mercenaria]